MHRHSIHPLPPLQEVELDEEAHACQFGAAVAEQFRGGRGRAAGGEDVVDQQHFLSGDDGVVVDLQGVGAIFEDVLVALLCPGELAGLADGNEAGAEALSDTTTEDEAARLDGRDGGDALAEEWLGQRGHRVVESLGVAEQRCDVAEQNPELGKVGHVADVGAQIHQNFTSKSPSLPVYSLVSCSILVTSANRGPSFSSSSHSSMALFSPSTMASTVASRLFSIQP